MGSHIQRNHELASPTQSPAGLNRLNRDTNLRFSPSCQSVDNFSVALGPFVATWDAERSEQTTTPSEASFIKLMARKFSSSCEFFVTGENGCFSGFFYYFFFFTALSCRECIRHCLVQICKAAFLLYIQVTQ